MNAENPAKPEPVGTPAKRRYDSTRRQQQAARTRADVLDAAVRLFSAHGWTATTLPLIATEAGVAVETIYSRFGSKKRLLRAAVDVAVAGDQLPVPFIARDEFRRLADGDRSDKIQLIAEIAVRIQVRSHGVWSAVDQAAAADDEIERWRTDLESNRHLDVGRVLERALGAAPAPAFHDLAWIILGPDTYGALTRDRGLTSGEIEHWLVGVLDAAWPTV